MKHILWVFFVFTVTTFLPLGQGVALAEAPIKHLNIPEVDSMAEAERIFIETTFEIGSKTNLNASELHEIHIITYTLEQSIAYFNNHLSGERQALTKELAEVVENIHLGSENNRKAETQQQLTTYFKLASLFLSKHWHISKDA